MVNIIRRIWLKLVIVHGTTEKTPKYMILKHSQVCHHGEITTQWTIMMED